MRILSFSICLHISLSPNLSHSINPTVINFKEKNQITSHTILSPSSHSRTTTTYNIRLTIPATSQFPWIFFLLPLSINWYRFFSKRWYQLFLDNPIIIITRCMFIYPKQTNSKINEIQILFSIN